MIGTAEPLYRRSREQASGDPALRGQDRFRIETLNISRGGFLIAFDSEVSDGDVLRLAFRHPETQAELRFEGQIQWMRHNAMENLGRFLAGVAFRDRTGEDIESLVGYAKKTSPTPLT
ncbi:MAG: PilZ domain-containing protein [Candidatus Coatesbacteria bacterium]